MVDEYSGVLNVLDPGAFMGDVEGEWALLMVCSLQKDHAAVLGIERLDLISHPQARSALEGLFESAPIGAAFAKAGMARGLPAATAAVFAYVAAAVFARPAVLKEKAGMDAAIEAGRGLRQLVEGHGAGLVTIRPSTARADVATLLQNLVGPEDDLALLRRYLSAAGRLMQLADNEPKVPDGEDGPPRPAAQALPPPPTPREVPGPLERAVFPARDEAGIAGPAPPYEELPAEQESDEEPTVAIRVPRTLPALDQIGRSAPRGILDRIQLRAAAAAAQGLAMADLAALTPAAIGDLGIALIDACVKHHPLGPIALGVASLYSGTPPAELATWPVFSQPPANPPAGSYICRKPLMFVVATRAAAGLPDAPRKFPDLYRVPQPHAFLPLNPEWHGAKTLAKAIAAHGEGQPFAAAPQVEQLRTYIEGRYRHNGTPVTLRRLATGMPEALAQAGVGRVEAALILGRKASLSTATALSYFAPTTQRAMQLYLRGGDLMSEWFGSGGQAPPMDPGAVPPGYLGARRCPTTAAVQAELGRWHDIDWSAPRGRPRYVLPDYLRIQSLVYEAALWCTGVRPNDGALDALLHATDFVLVDEKRKPGMEPSQSSSRALPIADRLGELVEMWRHHRRWTIDQLRLRHEPPAFFSLLGGVPVKLTTPKIRQQIQGMRLTPNAHRHYFRTEMAARDTDPTTLNAWMGHWRLGEEPGRTWSGRAPASVSPCDRKALDAHCEFLNFPMPTRAHRARTR